MMKTLLQIVALIALIVPVLSAQTQPTAEELIKAIERISKGSRYVSESLAEQLANNLGSPASEISHEKLSDREFQVMLHIGSGKTPQEITKKLSVSLSTVNTYRQRILQKMDMNSNLDLVRYCLKENLVD